LTTCTHHSELQLIKALSLSPHFTNHYTLSLFPACSVSNSRSLTTAFNSKDSSVSVAATCLYTNFLRYNLVLWLSRVSIHISYDIICSCCGCHVSIQISCFIIYSCCGSHVSIQISNVVSTCAVAVTCLYKFQMSYLLVRCLSRISIQISNVISTRAVAVTCLYTNFVLHNLLVMWLSRVCIQISCFIIYSCCDCHVSVYKFRAS
jgi:hypothetical protein